MNLTGHQILQRFLDQTGTPVQRVGAAGRLRLPALLREARSVAQPLLCLALQRPRAQIGSAEWREVMPGGTIAEAAKACFHVGTAAELIELLPLALRIAGNGRPGPVVLDLPQDVLDETLEAAWIPAAPATAAPHCAAAAASTAHTLAHLH